MQPIPNVSLVSRSIIAIVCLLAASTALAASNHNSMTRQSGPYTLNLNLLPAEPFVAPSKANDPAHAGAMVTGSGAAPVRRNGPAHPNYHLVVFISKHGQPVEQAKVSMRYQQQNGEHWHKLPVTQMWIAGKGRSTMHFGNNVHLAPGQYRVQVSVNSRPPVTFKLKAS